MSMFGSLGPPNGFILDSVWGSGCVPVRLGQPVAAKGGWSQFALPDFNRSVAKTESQSNRKFD